ncbi:hypothetical protein Fcan01_28546 [Folsomia candida]|uniref:Uncharacterized protein n=1 Tax=Folsomia candida TaxID=158441 RepID=A0A226CUX1_FOLCA|nr:hypothetical protein Fcan01_28546 [Folsomia candida]
MNPKQKKKDDLEVEEGTSCQIVVEKGTVKIQVQTRLRTKKREKMIQKVRQVELLVNAVRTPQTQEEKMLTFGEHVKNVIASIMQAAKNGEMVVTRKLLTDIVRSSEGLPMIIHTLDYQ